MVTPDEALQIILENIQTLTARTIPHADALGQTLARDIRSELDLPPFDNSAMDGYALRAADVQAASENSPVTLRVVQTIAAGDFSQVEVTPGACAKIMTGAPIPPGADAVIMREDTHENAESVAILASARPGQNIRRAGDDVRRGETVLRAGSVVRAAEWGMLASLNQAQVEVFSRPRVTILTTGDELVSPGEPLKPGQIRDSNSFTLSALVQAAGAEAGLMHVGDDTGEFEKALREAALCSDAIVTSGGVSMGDFDPVRDVLLAQATVHFWKIAMKPGKPVMFAGWKSDGRTVPVFGLPGNPVSVMVTFEQFVRPALLKMLGRRALRRVEVTAKLDAPLKSPAGKVEFVRALVAPDGDGWKANLTGDQGSGRLSTMTRANALLVVCADTTRLESGQKVVAQMTDWPEIE